MPNLTFFFQLTSNRQSVRKTVGKEIPAMWLDVPLVTVVALFLFQQFSTIVKHKQKQSHIICWIKLQSIPCSENGVQINEHLDMFWNISTTWTSDVSRLPWVLQCLVHGETFDWASWSSNSSSRTCFSFCLRKLLRTFSSVDICLFWDVNHWEFRIVYFKSFDHNPIFKQQNGMLTTRKNGMFIISNIGLRQCRFCW